MTAQTLLTPTGDKLVVIPIEEYEDLLDVREYAESMRSMLPGEFDALSPDQITALLAAASPLAFWRTYRGVSVPDLSAAASVPEADLARIEAGSVEGDVRHYERIAKALRIRIEDLIPG